MGTCREVLYTKYKISYVIKLQENSKYYLRYYYYESSQPRESKLEITGEQYDKLVEGRKYWFMVQFVKKDDPTNEGKLSKADTKLITIDYKFEVGSLAGVYQLKLKPLNSVGSYEVKWSDKLPRK